LWMWEQKLLTNFTKNRWLSTKFNFQNLEKENQAVFPVHQSIFNIFFNQNSNFV
jgi:hypothetical protein